MKLKFKDMKSADNIFKTLPKTPQEPKLSYRLGKLLKKFTPALDKVEDKGNELVRKHGELNNGRYNVSQDKMERFTAEFVAFLDEEVEINFEPIPFFLLEQTLYDKNIPMV